MPQKIIHDIPLNNIIEPERAMRTQVAMEKLEELAGSIRDVGVIQPITVILIGDKYEIESGHRRFLASQMAGKPTIPAIVRDADATDSEARKFHENFFREDVNPVDEGRWFVRLQSENSWRVRDIARFCSRSENYVSSRISLVTGDEKVLAALEAEHINFSQGVEILKCPQENIRHELLRVAIENGATVSSLRLMRYDYGRMNKAQSASGEAPHVAPENYTTAKHLIECPACCGSYGVNEIYPISVCKTCYDGLLAGFKQIKFEGG